NLAGSVTSTQTTLIVDSSIESTPKFDGVQQTEGAITILFTVEPAFAVSVEYKNNLSANQWTTLTNIEAKVSSVTAVVSDLISASPQRFYRLKATRIR